MNKPIILSGHDLVAKGITKIQATLPELGLKDVYPTGSWLEEKQIESAIEARKQLIEAERIEKSGVLSHAEWREQLNLAEVTQKSGGHWQFIGHNVGKKLFLYPEEVLFLMEVNSLLLKYNDVKVSLQQAYSLLLKDKSCTINFKVYASLSRLGYKVLRHKDTKNIIGNVSDTTHNEKPCSNVETVNAASNNSSSNDKVDISEELVETTVKNNIVPNIQDDQEDKNMTGEMRLANSDECGGSQNLTDDAEDAFISENPNQQHKRSIYQNQIEKLEKKILKPCNAKNIQKSFKFLSNLLNNQLVSIKVPENVLLPDNISFNKPEYTINLQSIQNRCLRPSSSHSRTYSITDEVNQNHIRRVEGAVNSRRNRNGAHFHPFNARIQTNQPHFRPVNFWQPFIRTNYFQFGMSFQRPFMANMCVTPRFQYNPGFQTFNRPYFNNYNPAHRDNATHSRKRSRQNTNNYHYESLKRLAARLKKLFLSGNVQHGNLEALNKLIQTYNTRYKSRLKLTDEYEIADENISETIILNDDEDVNSKRPRLDDHSETYTSNFNSIKELANRLKNLEHKDTRHRRAFSNLIKTFNKSYKADIYVTSNFEVFDKSHIILDSSSSDSDCVVDENTKGPRSKKLRNPFNILKRLSEKCNKSIDEPGTSSDFITRVDEDSEDCETILKNFNKNWLPDENDFGRPVIISTDTLNKITRPGNFIYEFMKYHPQSFESWRDLKVAFLRSLEETTEVFQKDSDSENKSRYNSLIKPEDCTNIATVLNKLSVIKSANRATEVNIMVNYDVYNRDVKNFRKTNPPTPHFRVSCLNESSHFPSGEEIAALHAKYEDSACIVFAVVGDGSISYVQIKPTSLPMHITSHNTT